MGAGGLTEGFDKFVSGPGVQAAGRGGVGQAVCVSVQRELVLGEGRQGDLLGQGGLF